MLYEVIKNVSSILEIYLHICVMEGLDMYIVNFWGFVKLKL